MRAIRWLFRLILGKRFPQHQGKLHVNGVYDELSIQRDQWGIPYIRAKNDHDAWFGLGFCHAQDRAFQLDSLVRVVRGQLAEMVGRPGLAVDRLARRIGFSRAAIEQEKVLSDEVRHMLKAYVQGVNAGLTSPGTPIPHEHALLRAKPLSWNASDILAILGLQSFILAANWDVELARWMIYKLDGPQALQDVDPMFNEEMPVTYPVGKSVGGTIERLADEIKALEDRVPIGGASNNWTMRSTRTSTGRPLLANDPHLNATVPSSWYLAHLETPEWKLSGASFAGTPTVPAGHNEYAAWGITAGLGDVTDLYLERVSDDGKRIEQDGDWQECEIVEETIKVNNEPDVVERVTITPRGPIISPALQGEWESISMQAMWLKPLPTEGLFCLHRVKSFDDFRQALSVWPVGTMNMVYADVTDTIGWQFAGTIPKRKNGWGLMPKPGWDSNYAWEDQPVPFEEMPYSCSTPNDDEADFISTANNQPLPEDAPGPFLGKDWMNGYRQMVIQDHLQASNDWSIDNTFQLQCNVESRPWQDIREVVLNLSTVDEQVNQALQLLSEWDGILAADSVGGAIFELFLAQIVNRALRAKVKHSYQWALGKGSVPLAPHNFFSHRRSAHAIQLIQKQPENWFNHTWAEEMIDALKSVMEQLTSLCGPDTNRWAWGTIRTLTPTHPFSGQKRWLASIFNLPTIPLGGDTNTVAQATVHPTTPLAGAMNTASLRAVMDVGNWSASRFAFPGGQSGNPFSVNYGDIYPIWQQETGIPIAWTTEEIEQAAQSILLLTPTN